jgi:16S rRNA (guanine(966)-N(2))-methyltransferase RsmD
VKSLRVIAGKAGGRHLRSVPGDITRPITDRAKESLFNIIGPDIQGAVFLDLFGGTGSVGIEALSRGAKLVRFVDRHPLAVETIRANLEDTNLSEGAEVFHMDAFVLLSQDADLEFDYVYIAPPQYKRMWKRALMLLDQRPDWLNTYAWVIVQIDPLEYEAVALQHLQEFDQREYGNTKFVFHILPEQAG